MREKRGFAARGQGVAGLGGREGEDEGGFSDDDEGVKDMG